MALIGIGVVVGKFGWPTPPVTPPPPKIKTVTVVKPAEPKVIVVNTSSIQHCDYTAPKPKPKPNPKPQPKPVPVPKSYQPMLYHVGPGEFALTIDDGPSPYTEQLLQVLKKYHAHVTFFDVGTMVKYRPQAVRDEVAAGDVVGLHTYDHKDLVNLSKKGQEWEFSEGLKYLQPLVPYRITLFRPPYGAFNNITKEVIVENKMRMVYWNEDPRDWAYTNPKIIAKRVLADAKSGGVVDMHDKLSTLRAMPAILQGLKQKGLKLVVISPTYQDVPSYGGTTKQPTSSPAKPASGNTISNTVSSSLK